MKLNLTRPLIFFDLETTGINILTDRIVQIAMLKVNADGEVEERTYNINPGIPIPPAATAVHHISDDDVKNEPKFKELAQEILAFFEDGDIAGFNSNKFDVPMLIEEFGRCGINFDVAGRNFIDVQNIFHKKEQRTLIAAYKFYCDKNLENAHSAMSDTRATYEVLLGQLGKYDDLANDVASLAEFSRMGSNLDLAGRFSLNEKGEAIFNFGKYKGKTLREVWVRDPHIFYWILNGEFSKNTKDVLLREMQKLKNAAYNK